MENGSKWNFDHISLRPVELMKYGNSKWLEVVPTHEELKSWRLMASKKRIASKREDSAPQGSNDNGEGKEVELIPESPRIKGRPLGEHLYKVAIRKHSTRRVALEFVVKESHLHPPPWKMYNQRYLKHTYALSIRTENLKAPKTPHAAAWLLNVLFEPPAN